MKRRHDMPFGPRLLDGGGVEFRLWAPATGTVGLELDDAAPLPMRAGSGGWHALKVPSARAGTRYAFRIGDLTVPDPASRRNPDDVHAASAVVDPQAYAWRDAAWRGLPWHEAVIYELHVGTFTREGSFAAAIDRLDALVRLGITAIELMPVAEFPGQANWGYDGVLLFAPDARYGTPEDLKRLVDAAHARGLMVLIDVVYNHFGPDGNYLHAYAPQFFNPRHQTPWGAAVNFDGPDCATVRDFFIHNALYWIEEFHADGLRLDAVHVIADDSAVHFIESLAHRVQAGPGRKRPVHLVLENDRNQSRFLVRDAGGRPRIATAQWNDDLHHAAHVIATGECDGYYADYANDPVRHFARALAEGFVYQGEPSAYRDGERRGESSVHLPPAAFVNFLQTHDQVGNRALGERIAQLADPAAVRALAACVWLAPAPPMLFMGEEFAASTPFLYFCDFQGPLADAVREGRRAEFGRFARFADPQARRDIPDPNDPDTRARSALDWTELEREPHRSALAFAQHLLTLRRRKLMPHLASAGSGTYRVRDPGLIAVTWPLAGGGHLHLLANLSAGTAEDASQLPGELIYASIPGEGTLPPWSVRLSLEHVHG